MAWLSRNDFTPSDKLHADDLNNLANDQRTWGGDVNGGGHVLSNVVLVGAKTAAAAVTSVFGRIGDVVAQAGDYTAAQVGAVPIARRVNAGPGLSGGGPLTADITLNALVTSVFGRTGAVTLTPSDISGATGVLVSRNINTGLGLTGGGNLSADLSLSVVPDTTNQQVQVRLAAISIGTRRAINFINGANITITAADNNANNCVDVTVASTGGSGGMTDPTTTLGDLIVRGVSITTRLAIGANGQVLTADSTQPLGLKWAAAAGGGGNVASVFGRTGTILAAAGDYTAAQVTNAVSTIVTYADPAWITSLSWGKITGAPAFMLDPTSAKGDLIVHGTVTSRMPVGADGSVLMADGTQALGLRWGTVPASVASVFGRTGAVVAASGDYSVAQVTGAVPNTRNIATGTGLTGGGNLTADRTLSVVPDSTNQQVQVLNTGTSVGTRRAINFISGANVSLSITDDTVNNRINISVASSGGSGGLVDPTTTIGDIIVRGPSAVQRLGVGLNGQVLTADSSVGVGVKWAYPTGGGPGGQTPWTSDIEGANFVLNNVGAIGVNGLSNASTTRVLVTTTGSEEVLAGTSTLAAGFASLTLANSSGDTLRLRNYGASYATNPETTAIESSVPLRLLANSAEIMRLAGGHVLIGTTTDDGIEMLQVAGKVKSAAGYVFPDGTLQTTASTPATAPVTSVFARTGAVVAQSGDYSASQVTNAVSTLGSYADPAWITSLAWSKITGAPSSGVASVFGRTGAVIAQTGDYSASQVTNAVSTAGSYADPAWITSLSWGKISGAPASFWLAGSGSAIYYNGGNVGIGTGASPAANLHVNAIGANVTMRVTADSTHWGGVQFENTGLTSPLRWALYMGTAGGAGSALSVYNYVNANDSLTISSAGNVGIGDTNPASALVVRRSGSVPFTDMVGEWDVGSMNVQFRGFSYSGSGTNIGAMFLGYAVRGTQAAPAATKAGDRLAWLGGCGYTNALSGNQATVILAAEGDWSATSAATAILFQTTPSGSTGAAERMRITSAGYVGIGTTPSSFLHLSYPGSLTLTIQSNSAGAPYITFLRGVGGQQWWMGSGITSNDAFSVYNQTTATFAWVVSPSNLVGINTANPNFRLTVRMATDQIFATTGPVNLTDGIAITSINDAYNSNRSMEFLGSKFVFSIGSVGINTTASPATALEVNGGITTSGNVGGYYFKDRGTNTNGFLWYANGGYGYLYNMANGATPMVVQASNNYVGHGGNPSYPFHAMAGRALFSNPNSEPYVVGIQSGVSSQVAWLGIDASNTFTVYNSGGGVCLQVFSNGIVTPGNVFTCTTKGSTFGQPSGSYASLLPSDANILFYNYSGGNWAGICCTGGGDIAIRAGLAGTGDATMIIRADGSNSTNGFIGMGKYPSYKLDVNGDCNLSAGFVYRINGVPISSGAISSKTVGGKSLNTTYQNNTGKPVFVVATVNLNANCYTQLWTDTSNPPSTVTSAATNTSGSASATFAVSGWVLPGHYYQVYCNGGSVTQWNEWN